MKRERMGALHLRLRLVFGIIIKRRAWSALANDPGNMDEVPVPLCMAAAAVTTNRGALVRG